MISNFFSPRPLLSALFLLIGATSAQALEFRVLGWANGWDDTLHYANGKTIVSVILDDGALSRPYLLDAGPLVLFREVKKENRVVRQTIANVPVPDGLERGILILTPTDQARSTYTGFWLDDSLEARPPGTVEIRNFSRRLVALKVKGAEIMLPAQGKAAFPFPTGTRRVPFQAAAMVDGKWEFLGATPLPVREDYRVLVMLRDGRPSPGQDTRVIDLLSFYDPPEPKPDGETPSSARSQDQGRHFSSALAAR